MKYFFLILLTLIVSLSGHAIELRRETSMTLNSQCKTDEYSNNVPLATAYINKIKDRIIQSNPDVFRDDISAARICAGVKISDIGDRAQATVESRSFIVDSSLILRAQNDAQLAYVIAHEMAHISLRHTLDGSPVTGPQRVPVQTALRNIFTATSELFSDSFSRQPNHLARQRELDALIRRENAIVNSAITTQLGPDYVNSWLEGEADLAGAHLYLRSGFTSDELAWRHQQIALANAAGTDVHGLPPDISSAERRSRAYAACHVSNPAQWREPPRGGQRYPHECWVIWKDLHGEPASDSQFRTLMNDNTSIVNLPGEPNLAAVHAELRANPEVILTKGNEEPDADATPRPAPPPKNNSAAAATTGSTAPAGPLAPVTAPAPNTTLTNPAPSTDEEAE